MSEQKRPQDINNGVTRPILILSVIVAVLVTAVITAVAMYFFTINMHASARESVVKDMQLVSATSKPDQQK